jgi:transposase
MSESVPESTTLAVPERRLGRPTKLTPELQQAIVDAMRKGMPMNKAAALAGISEFMVCEWVRRGEDRDTDRGYHERYAKFAQAIKTARAEHQRDMVEVIKGSAQGTPEKPGQWQAAAWLLERTDPDEYGMRARMDVSVQVKALIVKVSSEFGLTPDQLLSEARDLLKSTEQQNSQVIDMPSGE